MVAQSKKESTTYLLTLLAKFLNFTARISQSAKMLALAYQGQFVFDNILPFFMNIGIGYIEDVLTLKLLLLFQKSMQIMVI